MGSGADEQVCVEAGFLENALVMIAVLEENGKVISWNHAAEKITGYKTEDVVGSGNVWKSLYPDPDYRRMVTKKIADIFATRNYLENLETTIRTQSGKSRIILWNTKELSSGGMTRAIAVGMDITGYRELDAFRGSIIDNAFVLITVIGKDGNILVWNKAAESITGYQSPEVIGGRDVWKKLYPDPAYRKTVTEQIRAILAHQRYFENLETTITTKKGESRIISWNTREIGNAGGYHEIAVGEDITEQRKAEESLIAYISEMTMRLKQPIEIIADNLHETAGLIRDGKLTPEEIVMVLEGQVRNAGQIAVNVGEFQKAIIEKNRAIPDEYRKFLER